MKTNVFFKKNKDYKSVYGDPPTGSFALGASQKNLILWEHCREHFALKFSENVKGFFFCHPAGRGIDVAAFLLKFENVVQINYKHSFKNSSFRKTYKDNIIWIEPSKFWTSCKIKRSLFTILTRCSVNYRLNDDNFEDVLFGNYLENIYVRDTKIAFLRFMFGFTRWEQDSQNTLEEKHGWREEFLNLDKKTVKSKLVWPCHEKATGGLIESDFLWI